MLAAGKAAAENEHLNNLQFVLGDAAALPFLDHSFEIVLSRLTFHHFPDPVPPFSEMVRILKPGGKLVLIDMEATEEPLREIEDHLERLHDPSHVRNLSHAEMLALYHTHNLKVVNCETTRMPIALQDWLCHTATPHAIREQINTQMEQELHGSGQTGFAPYYRNFKIFFDQRWTFLIGRKG